MVPLLEARFGKWPTNRMAAPVKDFSVAIAPPKPGIFLIDRPQSPQSQIIGAFVTQARGGDDLVAFNAANTILGTDFLSRLNADIREKRGWSLWRPGLFLAARRPQSLYRAGAGAGRPDRPGDRGDAGRHQGLPRVRRRHAVGVQKVVKGNIASLPAEYETSGDVLGQMQSDALYGRPFDYVESLQGRYATLTRPDHGPGGARAHRSCPVQLGRGRRQGADREPAQGAEHADHAD